MRFLELATNRPEWKVGDPFVYPYWIGIGVDGSEPRVSVAEGVTHGAGGGHFSPREVLDGFERQLVGAHGEWLRPYLERLASGRSVTEDELRAAYRARHGDDPKTYDWDIGY